MSVVLDLNVACLVCLRKATKYRSVFDADVETPDMTIVEKIEKCSGLNFQLESVRLPDKICELCIADLTAAHRFQQNCREANTVFQYVQQQDEEAEVVATLELEQQQIKLPLGLKIKKMIGPEVKERQVSSSSKNVQNIEQLDENEEEEEVEGEEDSMEMTFEEQNFNVDQFNLTEAEDTANEELYMEETEEDDAEYITVPKKLEKSQVKLRQLSSMQEPPMKRGRGRPRKYIDKDETGQADAPKTNVEEGKSTVGKRQRAIPAEMRSSKICEICGNSYKYQHELKAHMRRHNNERPYQCEFCEKSFVACVELQRHMRVHTGHKPYPCHYCERRFSDFGSRRKHERTHTGERPYSCPTCNKTFAYAHVLSVHLRTHTGEKRFQCQRCGKGFTKRVYLQAHQSNLSRSPCIQADVGDSKGSQGDSQQGECFFTIVEQINDDDIVTIKEENHPMKFEYEEDEVGVHQAHIGIVTDVGIDEEQMAEEHLEDVDESDLFDIP